FSRDSSLISLSLLKLHEVKCFSNRHESAGCLFVSISTWSVRTNRKLGEGDKFESSGMVARIYFPEFSDGERRKSSAIRAQMHRPRH
ncbi:hypothetical protein PENTCL1PPCAC_21725, partial [Pristionchus entomophagus]